MQAMAVLTVLVTVVDVQSKGVDAIVLVPTSLTILILVRALFSAAAVTDKCLAVPSLINSLTSGERIDEERQYVVQYIVNSAAGFYVFGVRMTTAIAMKTIYFCGGVALAVATRLA